MKRTDHTFKVLGEAVAAAANTKAEVHADLHNSLRTEHAHERDGRDALHWWRRLRSRWSHRRKIEALLVESERHRAIAEQLRAEARMYERHGAKVLYELDAEDVEHFGLADVVSSIS